MADVLENTPLRLREIIFNLIERIEAEAPNYEASAAVATEHDLKNTELQIQAKRVENILDLCIKQLEAVFCLPRIIENNCEQSDGICLADEKEKLLNCFVDCRPNNDDESKSGEGKSDFDSEIAHCIQVTGKEGFRALFEQYKEDISISGKNVLFLLRELKQIAKHKIVMSASKELAKQKVLHQMWTKNYKNLRKIVDVRNEIEADDSRVSVIVAEKQDEIQRFLNERDRLNQKNMFEINKKIIDSNKAMLEICEFGKNRQQVLNEVATKTKEMYETLRRNDLYEEQEMKDKKIGLEHQLQEVIRQYDEEIGKRSLQLHQCNKLLQQETDILANWRTKYEAQVKIYDKIVTDKEAEEARDREEKLLLFMMNRSAVIIQRAYRRVLAKRKGKKKGKGKKGKK